MYNNTNNNKQFLLVYGYGQASCYSNWISFWK